MFEFYKMIMADVNIIFSIFWHTWHDVTCAGSFLERLEEARLSPTQEEVSMCGIAIVVENKTFQIRLIRTCMYIKKVDFVFFGM